MRVAVHGQGRAGGVVRAGQVRPGHGLDAKRLATSPAHTGGMRKMAVGLFVAKSTAPNKPHRLVSAT